MRNKYQDDYNCRSYGHWLMQGNRKTIFFMVLTLNLIMAHLPHILNYHKPLLYMLIVIVASSTVILYVVGKMIYNTRIDKYHRIENSRSNSKGSK